MDACARANIEPKCLASFFATVAPTCPGFLIRIEHTFQKELPCSEESRQEYFERSFP